MVAKPCECTKTQWIVHFERLNFMVCELYLSFKKNKRCAPRRRAFPWELQAGWKHQDLAALRQPELRAAELGGGQGGGRQGLSLLLLALDLGTNCTLKKGIHGLRWEEFQASNRKKKSLSRQNESLFKKARMSRQWEGIALSVDLFCTQTANQGFSGAEDRIATSGCLQALGFVFEWHSSGGRAWLSLLIFRYFYYILSQWTSFLVVKNYHFFHN